MKQDTKKKLMVVAALVGCASLVSVPIQAGAKGGACRHHDGGHGMGGLHARLMRFFHGEARVTPEQRLEEHHEALLSHLGEMLGLSDEQRSTISSLMDEARPELAEKLDEMAAKAWEIRDALRDGGDQDLTIRRLADEEGRLLSDFIVKAAALHEEARAELDEEQAKELRRLGSLMEALHRP